jgi:stage IV sporulation protein FB
MSWSFPIANIGGTIVRIHVTFLILLAWVALAFLFKDGAGEAVGALIFTIALFGCVLLHEFGHVFAARSFGIRTPDITLLPIGGLARLEKMPEQPWQELIVAIAGPLVNVVIAIILFLVLGIHGMPDLTDPKMLTFTSLPVLLMRLMIINVWLVIFNLIPAFPMDGGRVLRALLAMAMPYAKATATAATVGQGFAVIGAIYGLFSGNFILMLIAMFIFFAARGESAMVTEREAIRGLTLDQAMMTDFQTLPEHATLRDAVGHLLSGTQHDFPVLRPDGTLAGILTRQQLVRALAERGPDAPVAPFLVTEIPKIFPGTPLPRAIEILRQSPAEVLPVLSADESRILGLLSAENLAELLMIRQAVSGWHGR